MIFTTSPFFSPLHLLSLSLLISPLIFSFRVLPLSPLCLCSVSWSFLSLFCVVAVSAAALLLLVAAVLPSLNAVWLLLVLLCLLLVSGHSS